MAYMKRKRSVKSRRTKKALYPYRRRSTVPRDAFGASNCIERVDKDVYTTMVNSVFTSNGVFTKNNPDTTMFYWDLDGFGILSNSRGFTHLAERFQLFMLHWITMELNFGSSVAGSNHSIVVCYQPSLGGQGAPLGSTSSVANLEGSGGRTKTLTADSPKAKWTLTGVLLNELVHNSALSGYSIHSPYKTYMSSNQASGYRQPTIRFGNVIAYSPGVDITAAQPGQLTITIRMRVSFAAPSLTTTS